MATTSTSSAAHHQVFRTRLLGGKRIPLPNSEPFPIDCPRCGVPGALVDRVSATIYGWHDSIGQCGWVDRLTVGRDQHGATTLT
jgi:hypothetical protein